MIFGGIGILASHLASNQRERCCCPREARMRRPATATLASLQPRNSVLRYPWDVPPKGCPTSPSILPLRLTTLLMQEGSMCCTVAQVYTKREYAGATLVPREWHRSDTSM